MSRLDELVPSTLLTGSSGAIEVDRVESDSRRCGAGTLFFALPGSVTDGAQFTAEAVSRGAVAVVSAATLDLDVPTIQVASDELHPLLVHACAAVTNHPETRLRLAGVTGTNGKTTVTTVLAEMWRALGRDGDVIGTLTHERTTPAPPELYRELARVADRGGVDPLVALEVSSHALVQGRVDGLVFDVGGFTNLSQDHLDYHGDMEHYFAAKASLFTRERCRRAVVMADDAWGQRLLTSADVETEAVHRTDADGIELGLAETRFAWRGRTVRTHLTGTYNVDNCLVALAMAVALGVNEDDAVAALGAVPAVAGRMEVVRDAHPAVVVDYAHTPDGLAAAIAAAREARPNVPVIVVFGCGGDRDRAKRPLMGAAATAAASYTVVTSDNPRSEDPAAIIADIVAGADPHADVVQIVDRREAIAEALRVGRERDGVVLIAGKGHERTQVVGTRVLAFDDRDVARELLEATC